MNSKKWLIINNKKKVFQTAKKLKILVKGYSTHADDGNFIFILATFFQFLTLHIDFSLFCSSLFFCRYFPLTRLVQVKGKIHFFLLGIKMKIVRQDNEKTYLIFYFYERRGSTLQCYLKFYGKLINECTDKFFVLGMGIFLDFWLMEFCNFRNAFGVS
jgi:hypothetical protein